MSHVPVLLKETLSYLDPKPGENFVDATVGAGGHTEEIVKMIAPYGKLLGIDLSKTAIDKLNKKLSKSGSQVILARGNFSNIKKIAYNHTMDNIDGILADLGFSSDELVDPTLGLSFKLNAPLDMRLGGEGETAASIVNSYSADDLTKIIREYSEERFASQIAKAIVIARRKERILTTTALVEVIAGAVPKSYERGRIHPATRTFQALRIAVNNELENLKSFLEQSLDVLNSGGRIVIISFHSLEDRIVKRFFRKHLDKFEILTKRPIQAGEEEIAKNPRARSAKLRAAKKL